MVVWVCDVELLCVWCVDLTYKILTLHRASLLAPDEGSDENFDFQQSIERSTINFDGCVVKTSGQSPPST